MRLDIRALVIATGLVTAVLFAVCGLVLMASPDVGVVAARYVLHMEIQPPRPPLTPGVLLIGSIVWGVGSAFAVGLIAGLYNRLLERPFFVRRPHAAAARPA